MPYVCPVGAVLLGKDRRATALAERRGSVAVYDLARGAGLVFRSGVEMFFSLQELERHPIDFQEAFAPGIIDLGSEVQQTDALESSGRTTLIEEHHGNKGVIEDIRVVGELTTSIEASCARCLEPVRHSVRRSFDLLYRPQGSDAGREEVTVTQAEAEIGYYHGEGLLLEDVLREQLLLAVPIRMICREECKGLCPRCGRNRNTETCDCAEYIVDPRWDALRKLRDPSA